MKRMPKASWLVPGFLTLLTAVPTARADPALEKGFADALRGCEEWLLNPTSWMEGVDKFPAAAGLAGTMVAVDTTPVAAPPPQLRIANHYWRIDATQGVTFFLVVSDRLPMCHITGGGDADLQPDVESVLKGKLFTSHWGATEDGIRNGIVTTEFRHLEYPQFTVVISRALEPNQRRDQIQVIATAQFEPR
jgi:hypothetical protein